MPMLTNAKHEAVAQAYVLDPHKIGWKAYKFVYPKASQHAAENGFGRLWKNEEFCGRIAELQGDVVKSVEITLESLICEAEEIRALAVQLKQMAGATSALKLKSELSGHYVQRKESTIKYGETDWSLDDLVTFINDARAGVQPARKAGNGSDKPDQIH
jgi:hypothetical protein